MDNLALFPIIFHVPNARCCSTKVNLSALAKKIELHHLYRCLDLLSQEQESLKKHLFKTQQNLFSSSLNVVFYDVTKTYFDSQKEQEHFYLRSTLNAVQEKIINTFQLESPKDSTPQGIINQYFM